MQLKHRGKTTKRIHKTLDEQENLSAMVDDMLVYLASTDASVPRQLLAATGEVMHLTKTAISESCCDNHSPVEIWAGSIREYGWTASVLMSSVLSGCKYAIYKGACIGGTQLRSMVTMLGKQLDAMRHAERVLRVSVLDIQSGSARVLCGNMWYWFDGTLWHPFWETIPATKTKRTCYTGRRWEEWECTTASPEIMLAPTITTVASKCHDLFWTVSFSEGIHNVVWGTTPDGVLEWFSLRDKPEGRTRREALLHWVQSHHRRNKTNPDAIHEVRRHIRGSRHFEWFGMQCSISPRSCDETHPERHEEIPCNLNTKARP